ncbi:MAG: CBS domain-containing protein [Chloroflexi bacterium]|jgi:CBS domain-containing protein|nr:CBS domain-containing protein [Anaerolineaceae bacterium]NMB88727.1 CBS domain-containing protein [Chloroflexota bacterium]
MINKVRDWMSSPVVVIDPDSSVSYALTLMRRRNIHSLVVVLNEAESSYGIITSTDIRDKIIAMERKPSETTVHEIMTVPVMTANADWSLKECSVKMQENDIHHLPVVDDHNALVGLISTTDLFIAAEEIGWESKD